MMGSSTTSVRQGNGVCLTMLIVYKKYLDIVIFGLNNIYIISFLEIKLKINSII